VFHRDRRQRRITFFGLLGLLSVAIAPAIHAQGNWPQRPVKLVVPASPGGVLDVVMRILTPKLGHDLGQPFVIENKPGADFAIGAQLVARSAADGYTMLVGSIPMTTNPVLKKVPYDTTRDFAAVGLIGTASSVLVVPPALGVTTMGEFVALAKAKPPGTLNFANAAVGSLGHLNVALLENAAHIRTTSVLYPGQGALLTDLIANRANFAMLSPIVAVPHIQGGKLVPLAVAGKARSPMLPNVPTLAEAGFPNVDIESWLGVLAPAGTPPAIVARMNHALNAAVRDPEVLAQLERQGIAVDGQHSPQDFAKLLRDELARWPRLFEMAGIKHES
jgi:tripartite-type tricarboxylate transporter receptor subunit TctC